MSATKLRDRIFSNLHARVFKPRGFRKNGRWISKQVGQFHYAIERESDPWSSPDSARLSLVVYVFHEQFHALSIGWPTFPGVDRVSVPALRSRVTSLAKAPLEMTNVFPGTDEAEFTSWWANVLELGVMPVFDHATSLKGLWEVVQEHTPVNSIRDKAEAILLAMTGERELALSAMQRLVDQQRNEAGREAMRELRSRLAQLDADSSTGRPENPAKT